MYIVDFFKNLFKKANIGIIIWLVLNVALIMAIFSGGFADWRGALFGFAAYALSMVIALSPIGEWILRLQTGCKKITDQEVLARLQPIFDEVYAKAKALNPELPDKVKFFMSEDDAPNAFATGRKTICVTRGLLNYSDEHIKGVLAHEFGHLAHKDTDIILVVSVGNLIVTAIFVFVRIIYNITMGIAAVISAVSENGWVSLFSGLFVICSKITDFILVILMRLWTQIGVWLCMASSRKNEFLADEYASNCGYGYQLSEVLESFGTERSKNGLFASLSSSHPENADRVERLRNAGNMIADR